MEGFVKSRWVELGVVRVHLMGKGLFVFQLESEDAKEGALEKGPWNFSRRPLILRPWNVGMALEKPDRHLGYARVCVEVKVESTLFEEIPVKYGNGYVHYQKVHYEWVPSKCMKCKVFGHTDQICKAVQVFVPKKVTGKEVVIERGVATSSGSLQFGAIDQAALLPTPVGSVCSKAKEARPDNLLVEEFWRFRLCTGGGSVGKSKKKGKQNGRVIVPPPKPV
ncbi:hypothetical protein LIER_10468 [Lithospermum erythrorhizon]|uniref:DUF4283 domain-containing protein n=1 Tax=Lithospermum erythrorhizon TaxID=34254 RepID=A0AAV3PJK4_LITER